MPDYSKGKIYRIVCNITNEIYIGSTCDSLCCRMGNHRRGHRYHKNKNDGKNGCRSFQIIDRDDYAIVLLENFPCNDIYELKARERFYIESVKCINLMTPNRTMEEYENDPIVIERRKIYRENHIEQKAEWYKNNAERISLEGKIKTICECGSIVRSITTHSKSIKHQQFISSQDV